MALGDETKRRYALAIIWHVHGASVGMRRGVEHYRRYLAAGNNAEAIKQLRRAVRFPYRIQARLAPLLQKHGEEGVNEALALVSNHTVADLRAVLNPLKAYSDTLKDRYRNQGWTAEQLAADIEANAEYLDEDELVGIPSDYDDDL